MNHATIIPEEKELVELFKEDALGFFSLDESKIRSLMEIMENNPEVFSTYRIRHLMNISTDLAYRYHKLLFYLIHQFNTHDRNPVEIRKSLVSIGCKEKAVSILTEVLERLSKRNLDIYEIIYYDFRRSPENELNQGVLQHMRGELLLRPVRLQNGDTDWKLPITRIFLEFANISEESTRIELVLNMDELGRITSAFEEAYDNYISECQKA